MRAVRAICGFWYRAPPADEVAAAGAGAPQPTSASTSAAAPAATGMTIYNRYDDPASAAIAERYPGMIYQGYGKPTDNLHLWVTRESLAPPPRPVFVPPAQEAKGALSAEQKEFNRLVAAERPIAEKETEVLRFLDEHPDFNAKYVDKDGYTALFLVAKYELNEVAWRLVHSHKAQYLYLKSGGNTTANKAIIGNTEEGRILLEGIVKRNDIRGFIAIIEHWNLDYSDCFGEMYIDNHGFKLGLTILPFMAKLNRQEMIEMALNKNPEAVNKPKSDRVTGRGFPSALIEATRAGHEGLVRLLLDRGADPSFTTIEGETALSVAEAVGREDIAMLLRPSVTLGA